MNTGVGRGKEEGASPLEHSYWSLQQRNTHVHKYTMCILPARQPGLTPPLGTPSKTTERVLGVQL